MILLGYCNILTKTYLNTFQIKNICSKAVQARGNIFSGEIFGQSLMKIVDCKGILGKKKLVM